MMVQIYGRSGALKDLLSKLRQEDIQFDTLEAVFLFKKNWKTEIENHEEEQRNRLVNEIQQQKTSHEAYTKNYDNKIEERKHLLQKEKEIIKISIEKYSDKSKNPLKAIFYFIKLKGAIRRQKILEYSFEKELLRPFKKLKENFKRIKGEIKFKENNFDLVVEDRSDRYTRRIIKTKTKINSLYPLIAGAIGEKKTIEELQKLPDDYYVINDLKLVFYPPIFNRRENDRISSIQVDHIVIAPAGVFIIETKNWSEKSIERLDLFSPVKQIKRANYALFRILNDSQKIRLSKHHWGEKKVSIRNIILMISAIPKEEFQYVKILTLNRLQGYLKYFKLSLSNYDTKAIFNYLREYNKRKD